MKDFHTWTQEMAGTIDDESTVVINNRNTSERSELALRASLADSLIPEITEAKHALCWINIFRVTYTPSGILTNGDLAIITKSIELKKEHIAAETLPALIKLINKLRALR